MTALVPPNVASDADIAAALRALGPGRWVALTGAGVSTESGIPDYRGPGTLQRARNPVRFQSFVADPVARARYWARAVVGWERIRDAGPGPAHGALARLEDSGRLLGIITQNVDSLHQRAGARRVIELHGALRDVRCLACDRREPREDLQERLLRVNPGLRRAAAEVAPDGDADLPDAFLARFRPLGCLACGGVLKPDVVFFGENVPRPRVDAARAWVEEADALVVAGTSLTVFSGLRFVKQAADAQKPVVILNAGPTRGDPLAVVRVEGRVGDSLERLASAAGRSRSPPGRAPAG